MSCLILVSVLCRCSFVNNLSHDYHPSTHTPLHHKGREWHLHARGAKGGGGDLNVRGRQGEGREGKKKDRFAVRAASSFFLPHTL
jgi:hypothetical protein